MISLFKWFVPAALLFGMTSMPTVAAEFHVDRSRPNKATFISQATLDSFEGVTDKIDGYVLWPGDNAPATADQLASSELYFEVALDGLDTGIGLRNRHMRENYLETDKYPYASYKAKLSKVEKRDDTTYTAVATGTFSVHGVEKPLESTATVTATGSNLRVVSGFEVKLSDYNIKIPKLMFMKLNEIIQIRLDFNVKKIK